MYLQRMNARMGRGFARVMGGLDGGVSVRCIGRCERKPVAAAEGCVRLRSSRSINNSVFQDDRAGRVYDCCAAERSLRQLLQE